MVCFPMSSSDEEVYELSDGILEYASSCEYVYVEIWMTYIKYA